jgi:hypothetical protein
MQMSALRTTHFLHARQHRDISTSAPEHRHVASLAGPTAYSLVRVTAVVTPLNVL